ncbi:MAG: hypothetical protein NVS4B3_09840 [Gemmatimonadaceae bacterium]
MAAFRMASGRYIGHMSAATRRVFKKALEDGSFAPTYYLHGDEDYLKEETVRRLVARAVDPSTRDFNLDMRRGADLEPEVLEQLLETPPMMAERRVVVIRDVGSLKKAARAVLDCYLTRPAPGTILLLLSPSSAAKPDKAFLESCVELDYRPLTPDQVVQWAAQEVAVRGGTITPGAAELLHQAVGEELGEVVAEIEKLVSYANGRPIDEAAVGAVVGIRRGGTLADLLDRVAGRDAAGALAVLPVVLQQPKTTGVSVIMALTVQTLAVAWGRAMRDRGVPPRGINFFEFLSENRSSPVGRPWGDAARAWGAAIDGWTRQELDDALAALLAADIALKESRVSSEDDVLASLVLTLCGASMHHAA